MAVAQGEGDHPGPDGLGHLDRADHRLFGAVAQVPDPVRVGGRHHPDLIPGLHTQLFGVPGVEDDAVLRHEIGQIGMGDGARLGVEDIPLGDQVERVARTQPGRLVAQGIGHRHVAGHAIVRLAGEGVLAARGFLLVEVDQLAVLVGHLLTLVGHTLAVEAAAAVEHGHHLRPGRTDDPLPALRIEDVFGQMAP